MKYYLAYGSNLNKEQMKRRCPTAVPVGSALIKDYRLLFKGSLTGAYLTIEKAKGKSVPVGVWKINDSDELALDKYEGYPTFYYKKEIDIICMNASGQQKPIKAFIYIMDEKCKVNVPSNYYLRVCLDGYKDFNFDFKYIKEAYKVSARAVF